MAFLNLTRQGGMMQTIGYIKIDNKKILVLIRQGTTSRYLKLRKGGRYGVFMQDESNYLSQAPRVVKKLKNGQVIEL